MCTMNLKFYIHAFLLYGMCERTLALMFREITNEVFVKDSGVISAFGHFNSDEFTDVFCLQQGGRILQIFMFSESKQHFEAQINCSFENVVTSVVPGDFNGDSITDILITLSSDAIINEVKVLWGKNNSIDCKSKTLFNIRNQPLIVDYNGDMIPDIIGEDINGKRYVWISSNDTKFRNVSLSHMVNQQIKNPHSSGLLDLNNDLASDILIMGENNMEKWYNIGGKFIQNGTRSYPAGNVSQKVSFTLQSTFIDLNSDGIMDHIMPVCYDSSCSLCAILVWNDIASQWQTLYDEFKYQNVTWGFKLPVESIFEMAVLPFTLRAGDVNMDGYPDFVGVLQSKVKKSDVRVVIFKNVPCKSLNESTFNRCLDIEWDILGLDDMHDIQIATFFDIFEDGTLDILASSKEANGEWKIHALKNVETLDSCFIKVLVVSGLCYNSSVQSWYGVNQPGPIVKYNMTTQDGQPLVSSSVQISQSAYFSLQLPYSVFGLGQTPNFIDALTVSIPAKFEKNVHKREWTQIIPNSQMVVIPYPPDEESKWVKKLFVTPSHFVLLTCIALIGTCTFISIIVALLHWKEKKEDKKEKMQDAYRFHFDAM